MARPTRLNAGDTYTWTEAAGTATSIAYFYINDGGDTVFTVEATIASGTASFSLDGTVTEGEKPGVYTQYKATTTSGARVTTHEGELVVAPNVDGSSAKTHAQTVVPLLEAHIEGRVVQGLESHTIDGQTITKMSIEHARNLLRKYKAEMKAEQDLFRGNAGNGNIIRYRFT
jgi:hypothetical protein